MEEKNKMKILVIVSLIIIIIISIIIKKIKDNKYEEIEYNRIIESSDTIEYKQEEIKTIKIHISGEVKYNGIIELEEGARIDDAIKTAGGLTEDADISEVNLAYELLDGQKLYIPSKIAGADDSVCPQIIISENGEEIIEKSQNDNSKININIATQTELETLPGIGPSTAYKIIQYREKNGKFKMVEELKKIAGIGENKYKQIENFVEIK